MQLVWSMQGFLHGFLEHLHTQALFPTLQGYVRKWEQRNGIAAQLDPKAFFAVAQSDEEMWTASNPTTGQCPTFRHSGTGRIWSELHHRWVTGDEKLNSLGFPCYSDTAGAASVHQIDTRLMTQTHSMAGNSMNCHVLAVVLTATLASVRIHPEARVSDWCLRAMVSLNRRSPKTSQGS